MHLSILFDFLAYNRPLRSKLLNNSYSFSYSLSSGYVKSANMFVRNNHVTLADSFFQIGITEKKQFYSVETIRPDFSTHNAGLVYANILLRMEAREDSYERTVFSIFDFTGLVGGVFEIFEVTGGIIVGLFAYKLYMFSMLSNLYQVQKTHGGQDINKVIPRTRKVKSVFKRTKHDPKKYEESKLSLGNIKYDYI